MLAILMPLMLRLKTWLILTGLGIGMLSIITWILSLYLERPLFPHLIRLVPKTRYRGGGVRRGGSQSRAPTLCCPRRPGILWKMDSPRRVKQFLGRAFISIGAQRTWAISFFYRRTPPVWMSGKFPQLIGLKPTATGQSIARSMINAGSSPAWSIVDLLRSDWDIKLRESNKTADHLLKCTSESDEESL
ncbi:hypothetical protein GOBAR_DD28158 [Gossypium barbadense]|nr:hypothetical protein GOBAR_DD28158 [Gossypium barbadense]